MLNSNKSLCHLFLDILKFSFTALFIIIFLFIVNNNVYASDRDTQFWAQTVLTTPINGPDQPFQLYLEYQARHSNDLSRNDISFLRPAILYKLNSKITFGLGYLSLRGFDFEEIERRTWQQVQYFDSNNYFDYQIRARLEQRYRQNSVISGADDSQVLSRIRVLFRAQGKFQLYGFKPIFVDEFMAGLNSVSTDGFAKINSGYDQNRIFIGITRKLSDHLSFDFGYLHNNVLKGDGSTFLIHGGFANLFLKL